MIIGIPPFYDKNRNKMFLNIEQAPIRWPDQQKHGISASPEAQDLILKVPYLNFNSDNLISSLIETEKSAWATATMLKKS